MPEPKSTLKGVRTNFPCGPNRGKPADRYPEFADVPLLKRGSAIQCGAAGYWYVNADLSARLRRIFDTATDQFVLVLEDVRQGAESLVKESGKTVSKIAVLVGVVYLIGQYFTRGRK